MIIGTEKGGDRLKRSAIIKGNYRYSLKREWDDYNLRKAVFVLLNPSTAGDSVDDRTTMRCVSFAKKLGCGSVELVNIFAYRSRDWRNLRDLSLEEATGPENRFYLENALHSGSEIIVGWGENCTIHHRDYQELSDWFRGYNSNCLGTTREGHPRHPLFVRSDTPIQPFLFPNVSSFKTS